MNGEEMSTQQFDENGASVEADTVRALEAILMVAMEPVDPSLLAQLLEQPIDVVERLCAELASAYELAGHGFQLVKIAGGFRLQSHPDLASYVERFVLDSQEVRISSAALETLAIIAYKQPISRSQVSAIRGVDPDAVMRTLRGVTSQKLGVTTAQVRQSCLALRNCFWRSLVLHLLIGCQVFPNSFLMLQSLKHWRWVCG